MKPVSLEFEDLAVLLACGMRKIQSPDRINPAMVYIMKHGTSTWELLVNVKSAYGPTHPIKDDKNVIWNGMNRMELVTMDKLLVLALEMDHVWKVSRNKRSG